MYVWTRCGRPAMLETGAAMTLIRAGRIVGIFEGYRQGRVYRLADGSRWRQEDGHAESAYRENPGVRLLTDGTGRLYLDVQGTSGVVWVVPADSRPVPRAGAF